jgi:hypothetical protein
MKRLAGIPNPRSWKEVKSTTYPGGGVGRSCSRGPTTQPAARWRGDFWDYRKRQIWLRRNGVVGEGFDDMEIQRTQSR